MKLQLTSWYFDRTVQKVEIVLQSSLFQDTVGLGMWCQPLQCTLSPGLFWWTQTCQCRFADKLRSLANNINLEWDLPMCESCQMKKCMSACYFWLQMTWCPHCCTDFLQPPRCEATMIPMQPPVQILLWEHWRQQQKRQWICNNSKVS